MGEEREVKLAVGDGFVLPDLLRLDGVSSNDRGEERLRAQYWDTPDLGLAKAGVGIRQRNGLWTFKGVSRRDGDAVVREEVEVPGEAASLPDPLRGRISQLVDAREVRVVAELDTVRRSVDLRCEEMGAELVHDRVCVMDGDREVVRFEEVEVEYDESSRALVDRVVRLVRAHGAVVDDTPKYVRALRALGWDPPRVTA